MSETVYFADAKYIHNTDISLHAVKSKGGRDAHKLDKNLFEKIKKCHKFVFEKLWQQKAIVDDADQQRFYYICPLRHAFSGSDDLWIDIECTDRIYLGMGGMTDGRRLSAKEFRHRLPNRCSLKQENVEIIKPNKTSKIGISYGVHKEKFDKVRQQSNERAYRSEDLQSIASIDSFADQRLIYNADRLKGLNPEKVLNKDAQNDIVLVREDKPSIEVKPIEKERF